ncbi:MAG: purine-nucleoside phosphorylase [Candidatus Muiribacterium halophilum]|uniref:Purine nucleoside phosphorylase n=1 Tax=Muiribacterium halophilum TaxID=2053465 RepID=A0A2N5ZGK8_MUIH1|nr:MAG: purine-nucleoside phosphorylase [Candidatus Muirbacterium halophilum]
MENIKKTAEFLKKRLKEEPEIALILGSGLGSIAELIEDKTIIDYDQIPGFPVSKVEGHKNRFVAGRLSGKKVIAMQGRFHFYEGYSMQQIAMPLRVFKILGVESLLVTNAAGGLNPNFEVGDLMIIRDHINGMGTNPLIGPNLDEIGTRFPPMTGAYNCQELIKECAEKTSVPVVSGTYIALTGPCYETPAEQRMYRMFADAVGMSTVPEVITAVHAGYKNIAGISLITNVHTGTAHFIPNHEEVVEAATKAKPKFQKLVMSVIENM